MARRVPQAPRHLRAFEWVSRPVRRAPFGFHRYGTNVVLPPEGVSLLALVVEALQDFTVLTLLAAGAASLGLEYWLASRDGSEANWI